MYVVNVRSPYPYWTPSFQRTLQHPVTQSKISFFIKAIFPLGWPQCTQSTVYEKLQSQNIKNVEEEKNIYISFRMLNTYYTYVLFLKLHMDNTCIKTGVKNDRFFFCNSCSYILWTKISRTAAGKLRNYIYILNFHTFLMLNFLVWTINEQKKKNRIFVIPYLIWVYTKTLCNFMTWAEKWYWYWPFMKLFAHFLLSYNLCKTYLKWCIFIL